MAVKLHRPMAMETGNGGGGLLLYKQTARSLRAPPSPWRDDSPAHFSQPDQRPAASDMVSFRKMTACRLRLQTRMSCRAHNLTPPLLSTEHSKTKPSSFGSGAEEEGTMSRHGWSSIRTSCFVQDVGKTVSLCHVVNVGPILAHALQLANTVEK